jgi:hypothetical protein
MSSNRNSRINNQQRQMRQQMQRNRFSGGYEETLDENALISQRTQTDNLFQSNSLSTTNNIYDTVASVDYGMSLSTKGGSRKNRNNICSECGNRQNGGNTCIKGGCFTCSKGKKKLNMLTNIFSELIPKLYAEYKRKSSKSANKKQKKVVKGGLLDWSDWDGSYKWHPSPQSGIYKYDENILNTNYLNLSADRKNQGIYNVDTTLTDYTSALGR